MLGVTLKTQNDHNIINYHVIVKVVIIYVLLHPIIPYDEIPSNHRFHIWEILSTLLKQLLST